MSGGEQDPDDSRRHPRKEGPASYADHSNGPTCSATAMLYWGETAVGS